MKIHNIFVILFLASFGSIWGQTKISPQQYQTFKSIPQEKIHIHASNHFLLTGETLYYKIYTRLQSTNATSNLSKFAYIELINSNKRQVLQQKVQLKDGIGQGDIFIPSNLTSGVYKLVGYTKWMKNARQFFQENITIVNPFSGTPKTTQQVQLPNNNTVTTASKLGLSKTQYGKKEKVTLSLGALQQQLEGGTYSLSVKMRSPLAATQSTATNSITLQNPLKENTVILPEFRGELIHGKITAKNAEVSVNNIQIGLSIIQRNGIFKIVTTDKNGDFYFNLDENYIGETAYLQVLGKGDFTIKILKESDLNYSQLTFPKFVLDAKTIALINKRTIYMQIENAFNEAKQDQIFNPKSRSVLSGDDVIVYKLDDYKRFNTLRETFIEVISNAWIKKVGDGYIFRSKRKDFSITDPKALLVVDGYIVKDHGEIIDLNPRKIKQVIIYQKDHKINSKIYQGIIYIETFKLDYTPKRTTNIITHDLLKPTLIKSYFSPDYGRKSPKRIPDYRTQLLWVPQLPPTATTIRFYTSNVTGSFEIILEGYTKAGKQIRIQEFFNVN